MGVHLFMFIPWNKICFQVKPVPFFYIFCDDWQKLGKNKPTIFTKKCIKACIITKAPSLVTRPDDGSQADNRVPVYWAQRVIGTDLPSWTFLKITKRLEETSCFLTIMIHIRQVDLIAEEDHPFSQLHRSQHDSIRSSSVLTVMVKCFKEQLRGCCAGEVKPNDL